jgi:hypothetical protein
MLKLKVIIPILLLIILNFLILYRAYTTILPPESIFAECARNSGRTSAAINLIILLMLGRYGLKTIYKEKPKLTFYKILIVLFTVNHLIHLLFVFQNFKLQEMELNISENLHGFITFVCLALIPIIVSYSKILNKALYTFTIFHFFNITYFISISFYARYKPEDEAYLHRIGVLVMIISLVYILYRMIMELSLNKMSKLQDN